MDYASDELGGYQFAMHPTDKQIQASKQIEELKDTRMSNIRYPLHHSIRTK